jgi:hypothetical protein
MAIVSESYGKSESRQAFQLFVVGVCFSTSVLCRAKPFEQTEYPQPDWYQRSLRFVPEQTGIIILILLLILLLLPISE